MRSFKWCVMCGCDGPSVYARRWERSSVRPCVLGVRVSGPQDLAHPTLTTKGSLCRQCEESLQCRYISYMKRETLQEVSSFALAYP